MPRSPNFRRALLREAIEYLLSGDLDTRKAILRELVAGHERVLASLLQGRPYHALAMQVPAALYARSVWFVAASGSPSPELPVGARLGVQWTLTCVKSDAVGGGVTRGGACQA